jgi:hypothetical protein
MDTWPYWAVIAQNGEQLSEYGCSTVDSLFAMIRQDLEMPGVTAVITTAVSKETAHVNS